MRLYESKDSDNLINSAHREIETETKTETVLIKDQYRTLKSMIFTTLCYQKAQVCDFRQGDLKSYTNMQDINKSEL